MPYVLLVALILGPLLLPGYVLALDMVFVPWLPAPSYGSSTYPLQAVLYGLDRLLPADFVQKLLLAAVLVLAGTGMHRLWRWLSGGQVPARDAAVSGNRLAPYFAGSLYVINPFTYDRLVTGQYGVLFGYALLPWFLRSLLELLWQPAKRPALAVAAWAAAVAAVSIHSLGMVGLLAGLALAVRLWQLRTGGWRDRAARARLLAGPLALAVGGWLLLSLYWLWPALRGGNSQLQATAGFTTADRLAFATSGGTWWERLTNTLSLQGFWAERRGLFILPQDFWPAGVWYAAVLLLWLLVALGAVWLWRRRQPGWLVLLAGCIVVGAVLAAGIGAGWLAGHVPALAGYREPQKFAGLAALGFAGLAGFGYLALAGRWRGWPGRLAAALPFGLPLLLAPTMLWGTAGQLQATAYPADWYQVRQQLVSAEIDGRVLVLPWHLYLYNNQAGRVVANPAPRFFDTAGKPAVGSDDPEYQGVALSRPSSLTRQLDSLLRSAAADQPPPDMADRLAGQAVAYVILTKDPAYRDYDWLERTDGLRQVFDGPTIRLYQNTAFAP